MQVGAITRGTSRPLGVVLDLPALLVPNIAGRWASRLASSSELALLPQAGLRLPSLLLPTLLLAIILSPFPWISQGEVELRAE